MTPMKRSKPSFWLMKSEPSVYSIEDLKREKTAFWDGVRNYQARNFMMKDMQIGDQALFYHSNARPSGVAGLASVCGAAAPDPTAFDRKSPYFDLKSSKKAPRWFGVTVRFKRACRLIPLSRLRGEKPLQNMLLLKKGQRLSVMPVAEKEFQHILRMAVWRD